MLDLIYFLERLHSSIIDIKASLEGLIHDIVLLHRKLRSLRVSQ